MENVKFEKMPTEEQFSSMLFETASENNEDPKIKKKFADSIAREFEKFKTKAEDLLNNSKELEELLVRAEDKLKKLPKVGDKLAYIPQMLLLIGSCAKGEYKDISKTEIILMIAAIIYLVTPIDIIPDGIPLAGYFDDAVVTVVVYNLVQEDIDKYMNWRKENK